MLTPTFAEEDCEEPIVRLLLGGGDNRDREMAHMVAGYFEQYAPALPFIRHYPPGLHYHVFFYWGGYGSGPLRAVRHPNRGRVLRKRPGDGEEVWTDGGHRLHGDAPAVPGGREQAMTGQMDGTTDARRWCGMVIATIGETMDWLAGEGRMNHDDDDTGQAPQPAQHHD